MYDVTDCFQMERASDISVQVRGPRSEDRQCFFLLEEVLGVIDQVSWINKPI